MDVNMVYQVFHIYDHVFAEANPGNGFHSSHMPWTIRQQSSLEQQVNMIKIFKKSAKFNQKHCN